MNKISMEFDHSEAKGTITLEEGAFGAWVYVNGKVVAMIDLFYFSDYGDGDGYPHIAIYQDEMDEPVCHVKLMGNETRVTFEREHDVRHEFGRNLIVTVPSEGGDNEAQEGD